MRISRIVLALFLLAGAAILSNSMPQDAIARMGENQSKNQKTTMGAKEALHDLLAEQVAAWNRGDVAGFMRGYWKSEETTFSGSSGVSRGWQALLDRYRKNYSTPAIMGHLEFSDLEITELGSGAALILGRWHLERESGPIGGVFTLVARRFPEGWRIIHDHTSEVAAGNAGSH